MSIKLTFIFQMSFMDTVCNQIKDEKAAVKAVMNELITKKVQLEYSGCGKKTKNSNKQKKNFSETKTYMQMKGTLKCAVSVKYLFLLI